MYSTNFGFPNAAAVATGPYGAPPGSQNHQQQPGQAHLNQPQQQHQHQHPHQQQQQHMMYNPQQFSMGAQPSAGAFPGAPNMMPGAGPAGMMQNTGMQHMAAANGQSTRFEFRLPNYQAPYNNSSYGPAVAAQMNIPTSYTMGAGMPMAGFPMHPGMTPQQQHQMMQQRMQPAQPNAGGMSTPTPQRSFQSQPQGTPTPTNVPSSQPPQIPTPQNPQNTPQGGTPNNGQQPSQHQPPSNNIQTPQTPTFPSSLQGNPTNGTSSGPTPLSPGVDSKDKERFALILDINNELLVEAMQIQQTQQALKKERTSSNGSDNGATNGSENKPTEDEELLGSDYIQKDQAMPAPCPAYLKAPPLNTHVQVRPMQGPDGAESKVEPSDREATAKYIQDLYKKLQTLFPGIDPNKEPAIPLPTTRPGGQAINVPKPGSQTPSQASPIAGGNQTPKMATSGPPQPNPNVTGL
ncbi:hypothetical protein DL770_003254 [Monosporascus sp. CRB-9-2]|nr:hypothetical protein DL770_003254 [Monosporascus sp. CRB-9-2]